MANNNASKREIIFNYCYKDCGEISPTIINKIYNFNVDLNQIVNMDISEFTSLYGVRKQDLLDTLKTNYQYASIQSYSIYVLYGLGLSLSILNQLIDKGITKLYEVYFITKEELEKNYDLRASSIDKIMSVIADSGFDISDFINHNDFNEYLMNRVKDKEFTDSFKKSILREISEFDYPISVNYLKRGMPHRFLILDFDSTINELEKENLISKNNDLVEIYKPYFEDYVKSIDDSKEKYILFKKYYLEGLSLQAIADEFGVTRENIRQKIARVEIPKVQEDKYAYFFENYDLKDDKFNKVFGLSYPAIKYMKLKHKKGSKTINDLFDDENLDDDLRQKVVENLDKIVVIDGVKVVANKTELLKYVLKYVCKCETYITSDIINKHNELANSISHPELMMDEKYFHSHFVGYRYICLSSRGIEDETVSGYRYLDKGSSEIKSMITELKMDDYKDVEINASILYKANINLMIENDIRDEYELHSVLKYNIEEGYIKFGRSPIIIFGNGDRDRQILDLIIANSPIKSDVLVDLLVENYGYQKNSILAYLGTKFINYYNKGQYDYDSICIDDSIIDQLKSHLTNDVYFFEDIAEICQKHNIPYSSNLIGRYCIKKLGYVANGSYMYKNTYSSFKEYIDKNFFVDDFENLNNIDSRILSLILFNTYYLEKVKSLEYVEYKNKEFISINKLKSYGISKDDIKDYIKAVEEYSANDLVFTTTYLKNTGFKNKLYSFGFDSIFYDSILYNSDKLKFNRSGIRESVFVNKNSKKDPTVYNIVKQILGGRKEILLSDLADEYKIYGKSTNVLTHYYNFLYGTDLRYNAETKSIEKVD